ncbi:asparagine-tRNA ligase [Batrachochytrium dendrobatidis JEL423]|uniref:asparagine--tRNA ligase n=1 Tax=Batrachochytrium dendrobatidis (strain JEL423) TaxID=403673 RepID=A0A177WW63_BATDL|nr:asparagine-tRNA ligase [Batrachochytrium dendrobatidis JEL423]
MQQCSQWTAYLRRPYQRFSSTQYYMHNITCRYSTKNQKKYTFPITTIKSLVTDSTYIGKTVTVHGWVRSQRLQKTVTFIDLDDGSLLSGLQIVMDSSVAKTLTTGTSVKISGKLVPSPSKNQAVDLEAIDLTVLGECDPQAQEFTQVNMPILTTHDCEGGGEAFRVLTDDTLKSYQNYAVNYSQTTQHQALPLPDEFFGKPVYTTVSAQLHLEFMASALSRVYVLGPAFRAEKSQSTRHLAEFWMLEAEACFIPTISALTDLIEGNIKHVIQHVLNTCQEDLALFDQFSERDLVQKLDNVSNKLFERMTYTDAVQVLLNAEKGINGKRCAPEWQFPVKWGLPLQSEHEKFLAETIIKGPVFVTDYPKKIKPFYMKQSGIGNTSVTKCDGETVACTDLLLPKVGELAGGSLREDQYELLAQKINDAGLDSAQLEWYLDLRKYGSVPHGGYGMGFERLLGYLTGMTNIRDMIPAPRSYGHCKF